MNDPHQGGVSTRYVKDINTRAVLNTLREMRTAAIKDIALQCGLSVVTVQGIIRKLIDQKRVNPAGPSPSSGGRPSQCYAYNETYQLGLLLFTREIDQIDTVCIRVINLYGEHHDAADHAVPQIDYRSLETLIAETISTYKAVQAIAIGLPGVEYEGNIVTMDYSTFAGTPIRTQLQDRFSLPVIIENDVNAAVLGRREDAYPEGTMVYLYFPRKYPPGAGIKIQGTLITGKSGFAGEICRLPLDIPWGPETADSFRASTEAAAKVIISITAVLAPETFILFGEHISDAHIDRIRNICCSCLPKQVIPELVRSKDFSSDYEQGLKHLLLKSLEV